MCGRYLISSPPDAVRRLFGYDEQPNFPPRYNIAPTQPVPIVRLVHRRRSFGLVRWGLVPSWSREMPSSAPLINARADTINEKPSFRGAFRHRRCLMPADGFYEWQRQKPGPKQAYVIRRRDRAPFAMAAIWELWQTPDGSELESCAIITTDANATLAPIHHRMPVILDHRDWDDWLDIEKNRPKDVQDLLRPPADDLLEATPISDRVNKVSNDGADLLAPDTSEEVKPVAKKSGPEQFDLF